MTTAIAERIDTYRRALRTLRWIVRENLGKSRLIRLDGDWVAALRDRPR